MARSELALRPAAESPVIRKRSARTVAARAGFGVIDGKPRFKEQFAAQGDAFTSQRIITWQIGPRQRARKREPIRRGFGCRIKLGASLRRRGGRRKGPRGSRREGGLDAGRRSR